MFKLWKGGLVGLVAFCVGLMAAAHGNSRRTTSLSGTENALLAGSTVPLEARAILQRACQDCHSEKDRKSVV